MVKSAVDIANIISAHKAEIRAELMRISMLDKRIKGQMTRTWMPDGADTEYKDLLKKASGPWLEFTRDAIAQGSRVDGCNNDQLWAEWQRNGMDGRQGGIHREVTGLGKSYVLATPIGRIVDEELVDSFGVVQLDDAGEPLTIAREVADNTHVVMRPLSALSTFAHFDDPWDEFPAWVLVKVGKKKLADFWTSQWVFIDDEAIYRFDGSALSISAVSVFEHGLDYTPVALIPNTLPTEGEPESSIERAIPVYQRIVDATFTLEMVQRYGAFPQKYMSGGTVGVNANGQPLVRSSVDSLLHSSDPDTKFGTFAPANLADVVVAVDAHIKHLAALCQVPPHYLLGAVVNMSAEGIAAAESGYFRNVGERQDAMSEGYELLMRIAGDILGLSDDEVDAVEIHFEDVSTRSLSQVADAIGKLAALEIPLDRLFSMLPGFSQLDAKESARKAVVESRRVEALETPPAQNAIEPPVVIPS